jgi:hypothetical protein
LSPDLLHVEERRKIRWDPTINMGHVLSATASIVASLVFVIALYTSVDRRLVVLEEARASASLNARDRDDRLKEKFDDLKGGIKDTRESVELLRREIQEKRK